MKIVSEEEKLRRKAYVVEWRTKNAVEIKARRAASYLKNKDKIKASQARYYAANFEKVKAMRAAYHKANAAKLIAKALANRQANPERIKAYNAAYLKAHPETSRLHGLKRNAQKKSNSTPEQMRLANIKIKTMLSHRKTDCAYCSIRFLTKEMHVDHIIPLVKGGCHSPENLTMACKSCNSSKNDKTLFKEWIPLQPFLALN